MGLLIERYYLRSRLKSGCRQDCPPHILLERDVVVGDALAAELVFLLRGRGSAGGAAAAGLRDGLLRIFVAASAAASLTAATAPVAEKDHILRNHVRRVDLLAVLVFVAAGLQAPFNVNLLAFGQIVRQVPYPSSAGWWPLKISSPPLRRG
jgi:hypothetical protein